MATTRTTKDKTGTNKVDAVTDDEVYANETHDENGDPYPDVLDADIAPPYWGNEDDDVAETRRCKTYGKETVTVPEGFTVRNVDGRYHVHADGTHKDQLRDFYAVVDDPDDIETVLRENGRLD